MATGGLSLLGDAIAGGARDYMNITLADRRNAELRSQQLADEARRRQEQLADQQTQRGYVTADRSEARAYEKEIYDSRRFDHMKEALVQGGYLKMEDVGKPDAVAAGLKGFEATEGKQVTRDLQELATYKASIMPLLKDAGDVDGASRILTMTVADLPEARGIMTRVGQAIADKSQKQQDNQEANAKGFAFKVALHEVQRAAVMTRLGNAQNKLDAIQSGTYQFSDDDETAIENAARAANPEIPRGILTPSQEATLKDAVTKVRAGYLDKLTFALTNNAKVITSELNALTRSEDVTVAVGKAGGFAYTDDAKKSAGVKAPASIGAGDDAPSSDAATPAKAGSYEPNGATKDAGKPGAANPAGYAPGAGKALVTGATPPPVVVNPLVPPTVQGGDAPWYTIKGALQRTPSALMYAAASPGWLIDQGIRYGGPAVETAWDGRPYAPNRQGGPVFRAGSALGEAMANSMGRGDAPPKITADAPPRILADNPPRIFADNPTNIFADNPTRVLADNPPSILADNPPSIFSDNPPRILADNPTRILADNPPSIFADNPTRILADAPAEMTADQIAKIDKEIQWLIPSAGQAEAGKRLEYLRRLRATYAPQRKVAALGLP